MTNAEAIHTTIFAGGYMPHDLRLMDELRSLIEGHFKERHDPAFYSNRLHISLKRLNRLTNCYHQKTVYQLLQDRLHREAELLLKHSTLCAKQIAFELGVCDPAHFSKCFKKITGLPPLAFRQQKKGPVFTGPQVPQSNLNKIT